MDLSSISGSNWGAGVAIGGKAEQDIASFIAPFFTSRELRKANRIAEGTINSGYDKAGNYMTGAYNTGRSDIAVGRDSALGAVGSGYAGAEASQQPYATAGAEGMASLRDMVGRGGFKFNPGDLTQEPGYQFELQQGQNAIQSNAASRGGLLSGATLKALQKYGIDLASTKYGEAYNRAKSIYDTNFQGAYNLAGMGQSAANNISNIRSNRGTATGNIYTGAGQNLADIAGSYGSNMGNLETSRATNLTDLAIQRGNINAGEYQGYGNAAIGQGQHLQEIGAMQMGEGSGGGGSGGGVNANVDVNQLLSQIKGGQSTGNGVGLNYKNYALKYSGSGK
jgi:hypothetical protein